MGRSHATSGLIARVAVAGMVVALLLAPSALAGPRGDRLGGSAFPGYAAMLRDYQRMHVRAVWLAQHPHTAIPRPANARPASPLVTATAVQPISQDTLPTPPGAEADTQAEPDIAVDPLDPNTVVAVFQQGRFADIASVDPGFATSHDGGRTWTTGNLPNLTQAVGGVYERASDPVVAFGPDGAVYATTIALNEIQNPRSAATIQRSDDGGLKWGDPVIIRQDTNPSAFNDKEWVAVDDSVTSPHEGRIYVGWDRIFGSTQPPVMSYSDDRGQTWTPFKKLSSLPALGAQPLVAPNGDVTFVYVDVLTLELFSQTSRDGGATFGAPVKIADCLATDPPDQRDGGCIPNATADASTGILYTGWTDSRFRSDGLDDAVVARSTDGGHTWGPPIVVNPDVSGSGLEHMTTAIAAAGHAVHVVYFTRMKQGSTFVNAVRERYSVSHDDGQTFGSEIVVGPVIDLTYAAVTSGLKFLGDYMGVAGTSTVAHPVWCRSSKPPTPETYHQLAWSAIIR
jgi:BNR/Asp-box repeat